MIEIKQMLAAQKIRSKALREEYLDHYCTKYERLIEDKIPHEQAIYTIHQEINAFDFRNANHQYFKLHYQKPLVMSSTLILLLTAILSIPNEDPQRISEESCIENTAYMPVLTSNEDPPSINPIPSENLKVYSGFGMRMHPLKKVRKFHGGIDITAAMGTPVIAPSDGTIVKAGYHKKKGNWIEIQHDDIYFTRYYHLSKIDVTVNQVVKKGNKIGEVGSSGQSLGPHLHYEVIKAGKAVDPKAYLKV